MVRRRDDGVLDMMVPPPAARKWWPLTDGMFKRAIPVAGNRCPLRGSVKESGSRKAEKRPPTRSSASTPNTCSTSQPPAGVGDAQLDIGRDVHSPRVAVSCNRRRGAARGVTTTRGRAPTEGNSRPLASPSLRLTPGNVSFDQFNGLPRHRGVVDGPRAGSLPAVENLERRTEIESHRIFVLFDVAVGEGDSESGSSHSASLP